jgi:hypothetical protein
MIARPRIPHAAPPRITPAPFRFLEMEKEELRTNATQLDEAKLGVAPKALDPVDVVLAAGKLVFVVMNAPVFVTAQEQAVIAEPAVGIDGGLGKQLSLDDRLQLCPGAVLDHAGKDFAAAFEQSDDGRLARRLRVCAGPARAVGQSRTRQSLAVDPSQFARRQRRYVRTKHLQ